MLETFTTDSNVAKMDAYRMHSKNLPVKSLMEHAELYRIRHFDGT